MFASNAFACDPALPNINDLMNNASIGVVKGNILRAPTKQSPNRIVFQVTNVLRGRYALGKYELAEGGPFGSRCEYSEILMTYSSASASDSDLNLMTEKAQYLFISKQSANTLITPIFLGYGLPENNGYISTRHLNNEGLVESASVKKFIDYFRLKQKTATSLFSAQRKSKQ